MQTGILPIDKPKGFTSFDVIAKLRGITRQKKIGHAGTLDPMATGVLVCLLGNATRLCSLFPDENKRYLATVQFGMRTDSQDITGNVVDKNDGLLSVEALQHVLPAFTGSLSQIPPMVSALSVGGRRLYDLARTGIEVDRQPRSITVYALKLLGCDLLARTALLDITCSKGTYIRTIAHDIGNALGIGAVLSELRRTQACGYLQDDCVTLDWMQTHGQDGSWVSALRPVHDVFAPYPRLNVGRWQAEMLQNGVILSLAKLNDPPPGQYALWCEDVFLGLAWVDQQKQGMRLKKF